MDTFRKRKSGCVESIAHCTSPKCVFASQLKIVRRGSVSVEVVIGNNNPPEAIWGTLINISPASGV
jgi:hypothetical protein